MTPPTGQALKMRLELKQLSARHRLALKPITIPLTPPTQHAMVLEGFASTTDLDLERTQLRAYAFGYPLPRYCKEVPLLWKHQPDQVAGQIDDMDYADDGSLCVRATVTHELARRAGAFSIAAKVLNYEMKNTDGTDYYALINSAELTEVSITDAPSNPYALVHERYRVSPLVQHYDLLKQRVEKLIELTTFIKEQTNVH